MNLVSNEQPEWLNDEQIGRLDHGHCPDCDHRGFVLGPRGGAGMNIECGNLECRARFNVVQSTRSHHIAAAHRIERQSEGGSDWS